MKLIRKTAKFGNNDMQKFYHESFENYKEFLEKIEERQPNANQTLEQILENHSDSWTGVNSVQEAKDLLLYGWEKQVEQVKKEFNAQLDSLDKGRKPVSFSNIAGYMPIVPNAIMGLPNSMIDCKMEHKKSKIVRFMIAIDRAAYNSTEEIIKKMSKILAYIAMLERSGQYRCRLEVFFTAFSDMGDSRKTYTSVSVLVKNENQLFDIRRLCFPIVHPAMLRLLAFGWEESIPLKEEHRVGGYGTAFEHWDDSYKEQYKNMINENGEKIVMIDLETNIEELFKGKEGR